MRAILNSVASVASVTVAALALSACAAKTDDRPESLLLITIDTLRADGLGAYGNSRAATPWIDGLAERGVLFERALSPVPLTLPAHTSLMSGTYPTRHGVRDNGDFTVPGELETLAELFGKQGFRTGAFVGAFVLDRRWGLDQGFDTYSGDFAVEDAAKLVSIGDVQRRGDAVIDDALAWLHGLGPDDRFFTWIHLFDPHDPYEPPAPFDQRYAGDPYLGEIAYVDTQLARLGEWLESNGRLDSTVIAFAGDHGEAFGEHGESGHGFLLYQESVRVPLIVADPRMKDPGVRRSEPVSLVDLFSTLVERFGLTAPPDTQGRSLMPLFGDAGERFRERPVYTETYYPFFQYGWSPLTSLEDRRCVYIDSSEPELYDLEADPKQQKNLYGGDAGECAKLAGQHDAAVAELSRTPLSAQQQSPDGDAVAKLAALGYVGGKGRAELPASKEGLIAPRGRAEVHERINLARAAMINGKLERADELIGGVLAEQIEVGEVYSIAGSLRLKQNRPADAEAMFERGLRLDPDDFKQSLGLATARLQQGRAEEGIAALEAAVERRPDAPWTDLMLGSFARHAGQDDAAKRALERAVEQDPESAQARLELAILGVKQEQFARAEQLATEAIRLDPKLAGAHLCLAQSLEGQGRVEDALAAYAAEKAIAPADHRAAYGLGRLYGRLGRALDEQKELEESIRLAPEFAPAYLFLARNRMAAGDLDAARSRVEQALAQEPRGGDLVLAYYLLADLYSRTGDDARSREYAAKGKQAERQQGVRRDQGAARETGPG